MTTATNYVISTPRYFTQPISAVFTSASVPNGTVVRAADPTFGEGEFIYLPGVASCAVGSVVVFDTIANTTTLAVHTTAARGILAVAMAAIVAGSFGWFQISGANPNVLATGGTAGAKLYLTSTAGSVSTTVVATDGVDGALCTVSVSGGLVGVQLSGPTATGNG
jgi:hypothetical protein